VALGQEADEDALEHRVLSRDHATDLEQGFLEALLGLERRRDGELAAICGHGVLLVVGVP
jgi:hypothetical protein